MFPWPRVFGYLPPCEDPDPYMDRILTLSHTVISLESIKVYNSYVIHNVFDAEIATLLASV